jgi:hypothetical protein
LPTTYVGKSAHSRWSGRSRRAFSHASAAALWGLQRGEPTVIDVTARRTGRQRPGIRIRRPRGPRDVFTAAAGYRTLRFTDRRLTGRPEHVANAIRAVLADRRAA